MRLPDEVRKGIKGYDHFFFSTVYNNWNIQYWYWVLVETSTMTRSVDTATMESEDL